MSVAEKSLYERLGGVKAVANVVDDFIDRSMRNPTTLGNPAVAEGYKSITGPGIKYLVTEMVCDLTGGPQTYTGKSMLESHAHLGISLSGWNAFVGDLQTSLALFQVPQAEQDELLAIVSSTKDDIVTKGGVGHPFVQTCQVSLSSRVPLSKYPNLTGFSSETVPWTKG